MSDTVIEIQTVQITLGTKVYTVAEAGHMRAGPWRKRFVAEVRPLFEQIQGASTLSFATPGDLLHLLPLLEALFVDGIDRVFDLLLAYSAELTADKEYIAEHATERQILAAFYEVLKLADPFDMLPAVRRQIGRSSLGTLSSSAPVNGASPSSKRPRSPIAKSPG